MSGHEIETELREIFSEQQSNFCLMRSEITFGKVGVETQTTQLVSTLNLILSIKILTVCMILYSLKKDSKQLSKGQSLLLLCVHMFF